MGETADVKVLADKTLTQQSDDKNNKVDGNSLEYGVNRFGYRKTPAWQRPISSFFTPVQKNDAQKTNQQPSLPQITALKGFLEGAPVEIVIDVDVQAYFGLPPEEQPEKNQNADIEEIPEEEEDIEPDEPPAKRIKYDELAKHAHFLESLLF